MKYLLSIIILLLLVQCSELERCIYEVYQGGVLINKTCETCYFGSYPSNGSYYKKTDVRCKTK